MDLCSTSQIAFSVSWQSPYVFVKDGGKKWCRKSLFSAFERYYYNNLSHSHPTFLDFMR